MRPSKTLYKYAVQLFPVNIHFRALTSKSIHAKGKINITNCAGTIWAPCSIWRQILTSLLPNDLRRIAPSSIHQNEAILADDTSNYLYNWRNWQGNTCNFKSYCRERNKPYANQAKKIMANWFASSISLQSKSWRALQTCYLHLATNSTLYCWIINKGPSWYWVCNVWEQFTQYSQ